MREKSPCPAGKTACPRRKKYIVLGGKFIFNLKIYNCNLNLYIFKVKLYRFSLKINFSLYGRQFFPVPKASFQAEEDDFSQRETTNMDKPRLTRGWALRHDWYKGRKGDDGHRVLRGSTRGNKKGKGMRTSLCLPVI